MYTCIKIVWFSTGVIASNIITGILISSRAVGGLSADLYAFDCKYIYYDLYRILIECNKGVITSYLLIRQFTMKKIEENEVHEDTHSVQSSRSSLIIQNRPFNDIKSNTTCVNCHSTLTDIEKSCYRSSSS